MNVDKAKQFAKEKHKGQLDDSGLDYFTTHIEQVVSILRSITQDERVLSAAYLHDTIEDTETTYEELVVLFGHSIADLVMEMTHEGDKIRGYYFPRLHTKEGILIKFADRLSNMSRMESWPEERRTHYLKRSKFWKSE